MSASVFITSALNDSGFAGTKESGTAMTRTCTSAPYLIRISPASAQRRRIELSGEHGVAMIDVRRVDEERATASAVFHDAFEHRAVELRAHLFLEPGQREERRIVRQEEYEAARLDPPLLGVTVELDDALDRVVIAEEGE